MTVLRASLTVASISVGISLVIGSFLGLISGYYGGIIDQILGRLMDIIFSLPALLLAIVISGILGPSLKNAVMAIAIVYTPHFFRVARSGTIAISARPFVLSSKIIGATDFRILVDHIFPNISALLIVQTTVSFAYAILLEASLSFLGLGVQPPNPSLGSILNDGRPFLQLTPWMSIFPGIVIFLSVLVINLIGDTIADNKEVVLKVKGLHTSLFNSTGKAWLKVVRNLNFTVKKNQLLAIVGESGCGNL